MLDTLKKIFSGKKNVEDIYAVCDGKVISLSEVNDVAFAGEMIGPGVAIEPTANTIYAPCDGKIISVFPTLHAVSIKTNTGAEILIHIGIDTVKLKGEGFEVFVKDGQEVKKGDKLLNANFNLIKEKGFDTVIPIILCNSDIMKITDKKANLNVSNSDVVMSVEKRN